MQIMLGNEKFIIEIDYNRIKVLTNNVYLLNRNLAEKPESIIV